MKIIDFVSQIGGLFGLCIGFSAVSIIELFYWMTIRLCKNIVSKYILRTLCKHLSNNFLGKEELNKNERIVFFKLKQKYMFEKPRIVKLKL